MTDLLPLPPASSVPETPYIPVVRTESWRGSRGVGHPVYRMIPEGQRQVEAPDDGDEPRGFDWGYDGIRCRRLGRVILADVYDTWALEPMLVRMFTQEVVAKLGGMTGFVLTRAQVLAALERIGAPPEKKLPVASPQPQKAAPKKAADGERT